MTLVTRRSFGILSLGFAAAAAAILRTDSARAEDIAVEGFVALANALDAAPGLPQDGAGTGELS